EHATIPEVQSLAFSPTGERVVTITGAELFSLGSSIYFWDIPSGKKIASRRLGQSARMSTDGLTFLSRATSDRVATIQNVENGQEMGRLEGHTGPITATVYSPDGRWIATAGRDNTVRVWNAATGKELACFTERGETWWLTFSPDATR